MTIQCETVTSNDGWLSYERCKNEAVYTVTWRPFDWAHFQCEKHVRWEDKPCRVVELPREEKVNA